MKSTTTKSEKQNAGRITAAVIPDKGTDHETANTPDELDQYLKREAAIFKHRWPEEVLRDFRIENYWEFEDENEDIFSGYEVNRIAAEAERVGNSVAAVDIVRQFLRINHDDRAALDLFAAVASLKYDVRERRKEE